MERSWTINGRFLAQPLTGVQRYAFEIVRALDELIVNQPLLASRLKIELLVPRDAKVPSLRAISTRAIAIALCTATCGSRQHLQLTFEVDFSASAIPAP